MKPFNSFNPLRTLRLLIPAVVLSLVSPVANAVLIGYDGFVADTGGGNAAGEYLANPGTDTSSRHKLIAGQDPVIGGFSGSWVGNTVSAWDLGAGSTTPIASLQYADVISSGNAVARRFALGDAYRPLDAAGMGLSGDTILWVSFLFKMSDPTAAGRIEIGPATTANRSGVGLDLGNAAAGTITPYASGEYGTTTATIDGDTHLVVMRFNLKAVDQDQFTIWLDPDSTGPEPTVGTALMNGYIPADPGLNLANLLFRRFSGGTANQGVVFDEIRLADAWDRDLFGGEVLIGYDGFVPGTDPAAGEYAANPGTDTSGRYKLMAGQNPVIGGFSGSWTDVTAQWELGETPIASLSYPGVTASGSAAKRQFLLGDAYRAIDGSIGLAGDTTVYASFLFQMSDPAATGRIEFGPSTQANRTGIGLDLGTNIAGTITPYVSGSYGATTATIDGDVHLVVVRFKMSSTGNDQLTIWLDPDPTQANAPSDASALMNSSLADKAIDYLSFRRMGGTELNNGIVFDELRLAKVWGSALFNAGLPAGDPVVPILAIEIVGADILVSFESLTGQSYQLQKSTDSLGGFAPVGSAAAGTGGTVTLTDAGAVPAGSAKVFYQVTTSL